MFQSMMDSGQFNEQILAYARALQNATLPNTKTTLRVVGTGDKIAGMHAVEDGNRATAETSRTLEETANDPNVGASSKEMTMGELSLLAQMS